MPDRTAFSFAQQQDSSILITPVASSTVIAQSDLNQNQWVQLLQSYNNPQGWSVGGLFIGLLILSKVLGPGKGKISTGRIASSSEKLAAANLALTQIENLRKLQRYNEAKATEQPIPKVLEKNPPKHNQVTLWCGMPRYWVRNGFLKDMMANVQTMFGAPPTVFLPDIQRSMLVIGAPGSGKTFSVIDRAVESAFAQGIPVLLYDKKGDQMRLHAPLAARYGYKVHVFAPGESFSSILNPVEFVRDERDAVMAGELASVINRNASSGRGKSDEFFSKAGDMLAKGLIQLARGIQYPDMAMVYAIMKLPGLAQRLDYAIGQGTIDPWVASSLSQFVSSKDAEKTIAGILATAAATFSGFIQADLLPAFLGESNIPKRVEGKQLIIFKLDDERRSMVGPLVAAALHLCVVANLSTPRKDPIAIFLDELPSIRLDRLVSWVNEYRSNGGCFVLGIQSLNQLYEAYGDKLGAAIASACSTHVLFNPNDAKTAEEYSKRFGEKEVKLRNRSTSNSSGHSSSRSISWNESLQKMPLFTVDQIMRLSEGQCIISSPGYKSGREGSVPFPTKIPIPPADRKRAKESEALWFSHVQAALQKRVRDDLSDPDYLTEELEARIALAEELLPLPPDDDEEQEAVDYNERSTAVAVAAAPVSASVQTTESEPTAPCIYDFVDPTLLADIRFDSPE